MNTISGRLEHQYPQDDKGWGAVVLPLQRDLVRDVRPALLVLLGAVGFILLIACVNVANLSLARIFSRNKEVAIRTALGASSARIMRQVLVENVLLALLGGGLGLTYAHFGVRLIMAFLADKLPQLVSTGIDAKVLGFTAAVAILTGIISGILPALHLSRANVNQALKQGLGRTGTDSGGNRTRNTLVVIEVALSLVLLIGATGWAGDGFIVVDVGDSAAIFHYSCIGSAVMDSRYSSRFKDSSRSLFQNPLWPSKTKATLVDIGDRLRPVMTGLAVRL